MVRQPIYLDRFEPLYPCRHMETRHCPAVYESMCGDHHDQNGNISVCARYESDNPEPWWPEIEGAPQ